MTSNNVLELAPEEIAKFPAKDLPVLIGAAIQMDRDIKKLSELLDLCKGRLIEEAQREAAKDPETGQIRKNKAPLEGTSWTFQGSDGCAARVNFPDKSLVRGFWLAKDAAWLREGKDVRKLGDVEGTCVDKDGKNHFEKLFAKSFRPAKAFRELAMVVLGAARGSKLIDMVTQPTSPRVSFESKG